MITTRFKRISVCSVTTLLLAIFTSELFLKIYIGLGDPPLSVVHPSVEYMFKPNQSVTRFGNRFISNEYGMRSEPIGMKSSNGLRVMVFGDSVINGGSLTDQEELATTLLQRSLEETLDKDIVVGNISAGSWGPGNWLAYAEEFGFFDADVVVLVLSSHDYADVPSFAPLNEITHPTKQPMSALSELATRYVPRLVAKYASRREVDNLLTVEDRENEQKVLSAMSDLESFLKLAMSQTENVLVLQHPSKSEIESSSPESGYYKIKALSEGLGLKTQSLEPILREAIENDQNPYRDDIHINSLGQELLGKRMFEVVLNDSNGALK